MFKRNYKFEKQQKDQKKKKKQEEKRLKKLERSGSEIDGAPGEPEQTDEQPPQ